MDERYLKYVQIGFGVGFVGFFSLLIWFFSWIGNVEPSLSKKVFTDNENICKAYLLTDAFKIDELNYPDNKISSINYNKTTFNCEFLSSSNKTLFTLSMQEASKFVDEWVLIRYDDISIKNLSGSVINENNNGSGSSIQNDIDKKILNLSQDIERIKLNQKSNTSSGSINTKN